ncbi:hypothetical protein MG293_011091 [Ovis ammon polii]|uniref:Uncharacterized protein n=1 Tax=Ovis ammon polii TaxID=230172 RepID=A0AAD4Y8M1_OVIAM|nr:hypothetical protein MG293_011091 [Ovis ammon polii]
MTEQTSPRGALRVRLERAAASALSPPEQRYQHNQCPDVKSDYTPGEDQNPYTVTAFHTRAAFWLEPHEFSQQTLRKAIVGDEILRYRDWFKATDCHYSVTETVNHGVCCEWAKPVRNVKHFGN